jgi:L-2-hydroxyglutarate oxidase
LKSTGIVSYRAVAQKYAELVQNAGAKLSFDTRVEELREVGGEQTIVTNRGEVRARFVVNCGGLHSDRIARRAGCNPDAQIVPFRGEYFALMPERRQLVKNLIYPVPNPEFPFLGVHFTRMIDGTVHAGPNAVLAFAREGYAKSDFSWRDFSETVGFSGFRKLAAKHWREGWREIVRSISKRVFVRSLQKLIPEITERDIVPCAAGIRAQALRADGALVDDFLIVRGRNSLHVCNAPSPAATASLEIAAEIVNQIPAVERTVTAAA